MECLILEYLGLLGEKEKKTICYNAVLYETTQSFRYFSLKLHWQNLSLS